MALARGAWAEPRWRRRRGCRALLRAEAVAAPGLPRGAAMSEPEHLGVKRAESARLRRAEQLRRWKGSLTELEPAAPGGGRGRHRAGGTRVRFEEGAVFLAACSSGDTDEVKRLLGRGARVNTANVDGLTALHQVPPPPLASCSLGGRGPEPGPAAETVSQVAGPSPVSCILWPPLKQEPVLVSRDNLRCEKQHESVSESHSAE